MSRSLPAQATRVKADGTTERVALHSVAAGDLLSVARGAVIPVDAELAQGAAVVDESLVTGESRSERKLAGAALLGGSVNVGGPIRVVARSDVTSSTLSSIVALLERAQGVRPPIARAADRIASVLVVGILLLAALVAVAWMFVDPSRAFPASLAVLVVTCPCALSLATPVAVAAATTRIAKSGLLVTRADALERLASVDAVVLDKTGTLTCETPSISRVTLLGSADERTALAIAAALERASAHPVAAAFAAHAEPRFVACDLAECDGRGVAGRIGDERWRLGRRAFVMELTSQASGGQGSSGAQQASQASGAQRPSGAGQASRPPQASRPRQEDALCLGNEHGLVASFTLDEAVRADAATTVATLTRLGVEPVIASGDRQEAVDRVAASLGIQRGKGRLDPARKVELVRDLQGRGRRVLAIGDGVNDGPVLAASEVSCAMGQGSAIAQAAADFLLLNDALAAVAQAIATARQMLAVIRQNLRWAFAYNLAAVPLAAFDLVPPWLAAIGMSVSSLVVVLNARRLASGSAAP